MSVFDDFRALVPELFDAFELPAIVITRTTKVQTLADKAAGRKGSEYTSTIDGRGKIGPRTVRLADGSRVQETIALSSVALIKGDKIAIGTKVFEVIETTEINPDAQTPFMFTAVVR